MPTTYLDSTSSPNLDPWNWLGTLPSWVRAACCFARHEGNRRSAPPQNRSARKEIREQACRSLHAISACSSPVEPNPLHYEWSAPLPSITVEAGHKHILYKHTSQKCLDFRSLYGVPKIDEISINLSNKHMLIFRGPALLFFF